MKRPFVAFLFLYSVASYGYQTSNDTWDVSRDGNDNYGCAYRVGSSGFDYSEQAGPHVSINGSTISASITGTTVTLAGYFPSAQDVGNGVTFISGTNITPHILKIITAVNPTAHTWTLDSSPISSGTTTNAVANMGGSCASIQGALTLSTQVGQRTYVRYSPSPYRSSTTIILAGPQGGVEPLQTQSSILGYYSLHNDQPTGPNRPVILVNGVNGIEIDANSGWTIANLILDGRGASSGLIGVSANFGAAIINTEIRYFAQDCVISAIGSNAYAMPLQIYKSNIHHCGTAVGTGTAAVTIAETPMGVNIAYSYIHDNPFPALSIANSSGANVIDHSILSNSGVGVSTVDCVIVPSFLGMLVLTNSLIYGCGRDAVRWPNGGHSLVLSRLNYNIFAKYGEYGLNAVDYAGYGAPPYHPNAFWSVTGVGTSNNLALGSPHDIVLAPNQNPFNDDASGDYTLNNTAGAALKRIGFQLPIIAPTIDMGPYQSQ